jgi:hypothetical protein
MVGGVSLGRVGLLGMVGLSAGAGVVEGTVFAESGAREQLEKRANRQKMPIRMTYGDQNPIAF